MAKIRSRDRVRFSMVLEMSQRSAGIIEEIEAEILKGKLLPGERLPS
jgi:DNA-binding transcriptional regulator YhcF (GntR family)